MAIAPLEEAPRRDLSGPPLRLVPGGRPAAAPRRGTARHARRGPDEVGHTRSGHPAGWRAAPKPETRPVEGTPRVRSSAERRAALLARRRRSVAMLATVVAVALLSLPIRSLAGVTVSDQVAPDAIPSGLVPGSTYVVQSGDTLRSIARRAHAGDVGAFAQQLAAEIGSTVLVTGEHVVVP